MASAAGAFVTIDASSMRRRIFGLGKAQEVAAKPLGSTRGQEAARILRFGTKGVRAQFADQTEYRGKASMPWAKGHDFGNRKAPAKTMIGTGAYMSAFLGGANSITTITANSVRIGVSEAKFPQVKVHQGRFAVRIIRPKKTMKSGKGTDYNMRWKLGLTFGAWMSKARIKKGLRLPRRRVSVSSAVKREIGKYLARDIKLAIQSRKAQ